MAFGRPGASDARPGAIIPAGHTAAVVFGAADLAVYMPVGARQISRVVFRTPAKFTAVYADGGIDSAFFTVVAGGTSWEPNPRLAGGSSTPRPGQNQAPNVLGNTLPAGPGGMPNVAVYFDDAGGVYGIQFNGPASVVVVNQDGGFLSVQNAKPSGVPVNWANPSRSKVNL